MKYIKLFEYRIDDSSGSKFKKGDTIYLQNNSNTKLKIDIPYVIDEVEAFQDRDRIRYYYVLKNIYSGSFNEDRFISEFEYNANKYNL